MPSFTKRIIGELGLVSLYESPFDVKLLCLQRFTRMFAFGAAALVLALHLEQLGYSDQLTGLFMALTMLGDVLISFILTLFADRIGRKNVLVAGAALVCLSGVVFATARNYWILLAAAILGVVSPSGNEIGPFRAIEESILSSLAPTGVPNSRSDLFAWYMLAGTLGAALGTALSGSLVHVLMHNYDYTTLEAYRRLFWLYAGLGVAKLLFAVCLSQRIELNKSDKDDRPNATDEATDNAVSDSSERQPLLQSTSTSDMSFTTHTKEAKHSTLLPNISSQSRRHMTKLLPLFALDNFAAGLVPLSWLSPFFHDKYSLSHSTLGTLFFTANLIGATSNLVSASIARRAGLVYTMVFTHLPRNVALALIPVPGKEMAWLAMLFLVLRSAMCTMDTPPRQAFLATLLEPQERTAVMGLTNVVKTVAQSAGPYVSGVLKGRDLLWVSFVLAGALKVCYDLGILVGFWEWRGVQDGKREKGDVGEDDDRTRRHEVERGENAAGKGGVDEGRGLIDLVDEEQRGAAASRRASV
ncbi:MAG: hypothetical protein Q9159_005077 [Coniocarpon cinnabarinum]